MENSRIEVIWGSRILDDGFTSIPNLLIRNFRKLGVEHGEWSFICTILTYKHDHKDPYPSQKALADHLCVSESQIKKWVKSLKEKKLLRTGRRRSTVTQQWDNTVYNLKPLIDSCLRAVGEKELPEEQIPDFNVIWDDEPPQTPEVSMGSEPQILEVSLEGVPEVSLNITSIKKIDDDDDALAIIHIRNKFKSFPGFTQALLDTIVKRMPDASTISDLEAYLTESVERELARIAAKAEAHAAYSEVAATKQRNKSGLRNSKPRLEAAIPKENEPISKEELEQIRALARKLQDGH